MKNPSRVIGPRATTFETERAFGDLDHAIDELRVGHPEAFFEVGEEVDDVAAVTPQVETSVRESADEHERVRDPREKRPPAATVGALCFSADH
jgi:hypothetical protein